MNIITRTFAIAAGLALALAGSASAQSQESGTSGAGRWEISAFPGGGIFFAGGDSATTADFGEYALGASGTFNINRWVGVEGEAGAGISVDQDLSFAGETQRAAKVPHTLAYHGNVVYSPLGNDRGVVPYVTGGAGGLTLFSRDDVTSLGVTNDKTFLTGNVGGGIKWFASRYVGLRADYRLTGVRSQDNAPAFFGLDEPRYGHRIYGGVVLTAGR
jgi:hypothetical protein